MKKNFPTFQRIITWRENTWSDVIIHFLLFRQFCVNKMDQMKCFVFLFFSQFVMTCRGGEGWDELLRWLRRFGNSRKNFLSETMTCRTLSIHFKCMTQCESTFITRHHFVTRSFLIKYQDEQFSGSVFRVQSKTFVPMMSQVFIICAVLSIAIASKVDDKLPKIVVQFKDTRWAGVDVCLYSRFNYDSFP